MMTFRIYGKIKKCSKTPTSEAYCAGELRRMWTNETIPAPQRGSAASDIQRLRGSWPLPTAYDVYEYPLLMKLI